MARRVWIIAKKDQIEQSDIDAANAHNCPEIANGIPPALANTIFPELLPLAYEEPELPPPTPQRDFSKEIDELKARITVVEGKVPK